MFDQAKADAICKAIAGGMSLRKAAAAHGESHSTVLDWERDNASFSDQYARAREVGYKLLADEIIEIADDARGDVIETENGPRMDAEFVARSRLRLDARKWMLSKMLPKVYGDKLDVQHGGKMEVISRVERAVVSKSPGQDAAA